MVSFRTVSHFFHQALAILRRNRCPNIDNFQISSILSGQVSEPILLLQLKLTSGWWSNVARKARAFPNGRRQWSLQYTRRHFTWYMATWWNAPDQNTELSISSTSAFPRARLIFWPVFKQYFTFQRCKAYLYHNQIVVQVAEKYFRSVWVFSLKHNVTHIL